MTSLNRRNFTKALALGLVAAPALASKAFADGHAAKHAVAIKGMKFSPANLTIKAGDTVVFTNEDGAPHTATADNNAFDTGRLGKGDASSIKFSQAGTFEYFCAVHPGMRAKITVAG